MHLRIIDVEGTPEEIAALPQLSEVLGLDLRQETDDRGGLSHGPAPATDSVARQSELPANVVSVLRRRRPATEIYRLSVAFLAEVLGWPDVDARVGVSRRTDDGMANAIRLHCRGSAVGAFTYLRLPAGTMTFRLPVDFSDRELEYAVPRRVSPEAPYGLALKLASAEALDEALELTRAAFDAARWSGWDPVETARPVGDSRVRQ